jgi:hypothetical protein
MLLWITFGFETSNQFMRSITVWSILMSLAYWVKFSSTDNKVRELIAVEMLHTSLLNITVVAFKVLLLGSYAPMPAPSSPFTTNLELVLWNGLQSCCRITPDVINVIKMPSFHWGLDPVNGEGVPAQLFVY